MNVQTLGWSLLLAASIAAAPPVAPEAGPSDAALLETARAARRAGDSVAAAEAWARLAERRPGAPEPVYNLGVTAAEAGDLDRAVAAFERALSLSRDPALTARAAYNLGTTALRRARDPAAASPPAPGEDSADPVAAADAALVESLRRFREALDADPTDEDARANGELAWRMLDALRQQQQQQEGEGEGEPQEGEGEPQEGEGEPQEGEGEPQEGEGEPQESEQQQQSSSSDSESESDQQQQQPGAEPSPQDPQPSDSGEPSESEERSEGAAPPEERESGEESPAEADASPEEQAAPEPGTDAPPEDAGEESEAEPSEAAGGATRKTPPRDGMSREEAERLLQSVRDKERRRQEELARRAARRHEAPERDW